MLSVKPDVKFRDPRSGVELGAPILIALLVWIDVCARHNKPVTITSALEGNHSKKSLHYSGNAIDLRTRHLLKSELTEIVKDVRLSLTKDFDVIVEGTHVHIEFDPK